MRSEGARGNPRSPFKGIVPRRGVGPGRARRGGAGGAERAGPGGGRLRLACGIGRGRPTLQRGDRDHGRAGCAKTGLDSCGDCACIAPVLGSRAAADSPTHTHFARIYRPDTSSPFSRSFGCCPLRNLESFFGHEKRIDRAPLGAHRKRLFVGSSRCLERDAIGASLFFVRTPAVGA